ncbi:beta-glucosidase family protein [Fulvimonas soli]|uniref:Beta-glucosidase n=1 Tax=Fulvimonas soli TaxID=155197 RepID=A0A316I339_9GAMM|nr:glycoside hydrolase family 3 protein [Fulvimonas soli]PWK86793.1 beta-glucosidase [Fulvimonas soli]TNY27172.1 glycosyl hydrolase [Fulvimonas soli]
MKGKSRHALRTAALAASLLGCVGAVAATRPWMDAAQPPDARANALQAQLTLEEKLQLVRSVFAQPDAAKGRPMPAGALGSAGYVPGIPRLGIPALQESDAGLGVANPANVRPGDGATSLPAGLAVAASWDPAVAYAGGAMIGGEAHAKGFNVLLAGGIDLQREPRNGRNFEYAGEDPLLAGTLVGEAIRGIQGRHVLSTIKHYALNDQETARNTIDVRIGERAARESDLLAFELAIERGRPGSVMCSYNKVDGDWACENDFLLNQVLKGDWKYPGFVMSDWGAVHSVAKAANAGLDQESAGDVFDAQVFFDAPLKEALARGEVKPARLDDMVHRILRSMFAAGLFDHPAAKAPIDERASLGVARRAEEAGAVLLRNEHALLPLARPASIAVIGAHADKGVLAGGGSSLVIPRGGNAVPGLKPETWPGPVVYHPSAPLAAIRALAGKARVDFAPGDDPAAAAALAAKAQVAVVFVQQWAAESVDAADLALPDHQDALVEAVAKANPRTVVVLETNSPVAMPWLDRVGAVLAAWYPGSAGGEAIANLLFGRADPSGRLPITWPRDLAQLPRPVLEGAGAAPGTPPPASVDYAIEGADVGYRWFQRQGLEPLFPFGYGLSYTRFEHGAPKVALKDGLPRVSVEVRNVGKRAGADVVQVYAQVPGSPIRRLAGFAKVALQPGQARTVEVALEPRLLSDFDTAKRHWVLRGGDYALYVGRSATDLAEPVHVQLPARE